MLSLYGLPIIESLNCLEKTQDPRKVHIRRKWMSETYHRRIQKKWIKRFGYVYKPVAYRTPQGIICHPSIANQIRRQLGNQR